MINLHIDIETFSSTNLKTSGLYKYAESEDFEILMVAFAFDDEPVQIVDLAQGEKLPKRFTRALKNPKVKKHAHNATFERICFRAFGIDVPIKDWKCTMVQAANCGLPLSLAQVSDALELGENGKLSEGRALIRYFCLPCKPTKVNGGRTRNLPHHAPEKWERFKVYCKGDVTAERSAFRLLRKYPVIDFERQLYILDQQINDRGILIDLYFANKAFTMNGEHCEQLLKRTKEITELENPNSPAQLKKWLSEATGNEITSLAKDSLKALIEDYSAGSVLMQTGTTTKSGIVMFPTNELQGMKINYVDVKAVLEVLKLRQMLSKTSIKKYVAMGVCASEKDERARGLFQFCGANRTGRWAGRLIQLHNLPRNYLKHLANIRAIVRSGDYQLLSSIYYDVSDKLSQLIRTAFIAPRGSVFAVSDFSAIEARVLAWLAGEQWRLDIFNGDGKIYEASASMMFGVPIEQVTKGSELRYKGKVSELALGYQGSVGALRQMGAGNKTIEEATDSELKVIVNKWRKASPAIVTLWKRMEAAAKLAVKKRRKIKTNYQGIVFDYDGSVLTIQLPSGRKLFYQDPSFALNSWGKECLQYKGIDDKRKWANIKTYGGKLVENIVQAIARDLLANSLIRLDEEGFKIVMHVHDEAAAEVAKRNAEAELKKMCQIMGEDVPWAPGLPLTADGYCTPFYKKD